MGNGGNPMLTPEQQAVVDCRARMPGASHAEIAAEMGITLTSAKRRWQRAQRWIEAPAGQQESIAESRLDIATAEGGWIITDKDGEIIRRSTRWKASQDEAKSIADLLHDTFEDLRADQYPVYPPRKTESNGSLLVVDLSDVHVMKLCVQEETGATYNREVAIHRMVEGTRGLLAKASGIGIGRVLVVLGNDILHVDNAKSTTTSGTHQDTDGTIHQGYRDAVAGYVRVIELCAEVADVDLIYVPSNHDWVMGWALANQVATWFRNHPNVNASPYNLSERHRKYYRFGTSLIGLTHGDGAKEADLGPLMTAEARAHVGECLHRYWYVHHLHHKIRKAQGVLSHSREKDHIGMTMVQAGVKTMEGDNIEIEYVRSPSPPDSWHDRNGYVNRQAVECFAHDPHEGQNARFTEWF